MASRNLYKEVSERILTELKSGAAPWVRPWAAVAGSGQVCNATTSRPYSGVNVVLLWMTMQANGYAVPRFLTFKQAQEVGGTVRRGEKGTKVYFVSSIEVKDRDNQDETRRVPFLKEYTVFNVAQCDGLPERIANGDRKAKTRNPGERDELADEFVAATLADVRHGEAQAYYRPAADFVMMPEFRSFSSADHYYATLFHELGHWTGAERRLNRQLGNRFGSEAYAAEELIAELTAAFLCAEFSINGDIRHAGYIQSWIRLLEKDDKAFFTAASAAQKAADHLRELALSEAAHGLWRACGGRMMPINAMGYHNVPGKLSPAQAVRLLSEHRVAVYEADAVRIVCNAMTRDPDERYTFKARQGTYSARKLADWLGW